MVRFVFRHLTSILVIVAILLWAVLYLPGTPSFAVFQLKQAIDARNGDAAANFVDFPKVVRAAGYEMMQERSGGLLGEFLGKGAVDLFSGPMAALLKSWAVQQVNHGAQDVQMPAAAVAGAILTLHRHDDSAFTRWRDNKGQVWEVRMAREEGGWQVTEVKNVQQLLEKLERQQGKALNPPPGDMNPPEGSNPPPTP